MKKLYYLIVLALILGLVLTGCSLLSNVGQVPTNEQSGITYLTKHIGGNPYEITLFAGQTTDVGTVKVWNDAVNLYVKYETKDGWVMTETHLAVVIDEGDFPMTNKGNPRVGHFPYQCCYEDATQWEFQSKEGNAGAGCDADGKPAATLTEILYTIPLNGWDEGLFIAAHAVVVDMNIDSKTEVVVVSRHNDGIDVYGPLDSYVDLGDSLWDPSITAVATLQHGLWAPISAQFPDATWISTTFAQVDPVEARWRWFHDEITLPEKGIYISSGMVVATADNAEEFYFNEESIGSNQHWPTITTYSLEPKLGTNTLDFIVKNWGGYTGLIYKATIVYYPEETAWADGKRFTGKGNWATYIDDYIVQEVGVLDLYQKDPITWEKVLDGAEGQLIYNSSGSTFDFVFNGHGLEPGWSYTLIYYPDPWPGTGLICLGSGTADGLGDLNFMGSVEINTDLPIAGDTNAPGAKIWLVLSDDVDCIAGSWALPWVWNPSEYLFEHDLITFNDTDIP